MKFFFISLFFLLFPLDYAYALQSHGGPEGVYIHLAAHIIFFTAMLSLSIWLRRTRLKPYTAWRAIAMGAFVLALWNVWAFAGHVLDGIILERGDLYLDQDQVPCLRIQSWENLLFYLLKLDHLLYLPAIWLFYVGLRRLRLYDASGEER